MFKPIVRDTNFDSSHGIDTVGAIARQAAERAGRNGKHRPAGYKAIPVYDNGGEVTEAQRLAIAPLGKAQGSSTDGEMTEAQRLSIAPVRQTPVYDRGGNVDVNDGHHQLAVIEDGERVLNPAETRAYDRTHGTKGPTKMKAAMPKINLYDDGGETKGAPADFPGIVLPNPEGVQPVDSDNIQPLVDEPTKDAHFTLATEQSPEKLKAADVVNNPGARTATSDVDTLIPERDTTKEETPTQGSVLGREWLKRMGVKPAETTTSDAAGTIAERTAGMPQIKTPASSVVPSETLALIPGTPENRAAKEYHQDSAGGALIPGAPTAETPSEQRDLRNMERKAKIADLEKQRQQALLDGDEVKADKLNIAKIALQKTPWTDRSTLGKIGHVAEAVLSRAPISAGFAAIIPGSEGWNAAGSQAAREQLGKDTESELKEAQADTKQSPKPKLLPGEGNTAVTPDGTRYQRYEMPDGSTAWAQEGTVPRVATATPPTTGGIPQIAPVTGGLPAGAVVGKPAGEPKAETREQHLNRYAELKNLQESGATLSDQDQKEFNTLKTELTVPKATMDSYNKQIDSALHAAGVDQSLWSNYHVLPGATAEEAKQAIADAKAFSGETYQQAAEGRTMDKEERAQERKDKATTVYAEDENGQLFKTSKYEADRRGLVSEEMKAGDISKDRSAIRQLNDVQTNVNRYEKVMAEDMPKVSEEDRKRMTTILAINSETNGGLLQADAGGKFISISGAAPQWSAQISSRKFDLAKEQLEALSPEAKRVMNAYLRTAASVPTYLKALAGIGRSNKETLNLELANVPMPYYDLETARGRMQSFQDNVDQAKSGFPNNLPGMKLVESERDKTTKSTYTAPKPEDVVKSGTFNNKPVFKLKNGTTVYADGRPVEVK